MKQVEVVAAVIEKDNKILATQRGSGKFQGMWEFPGGKIEDGESHTIALTREIEEELDANIVVGDFITTTEFDYPTFHLTMHCYFCEVKDEIKLLEHSDAKWLTVDEFDQVNWLPADIDVVEKVRRVKKGTSLTLK